MESQQAFSVQVVIQVQEQGWGHLLRAWHGQPSVGTSPGCTQKPLPYLLLTVRCMAPLLLPPGEAFLPLSFLCEHGHISTCPLALDLPPTPLGHGLSPPEALHMATSPMRASAGSSWVLTVPSAFHPVSKAGRVGTCPAGMLERSVGL